MNNFISLSFAIIISLFSTKHANAQKIQSTHFVVEGNCNMCKARIEKSALIKGVKEAVWDKNSDTLKVVFNSSRITAEDIKQAIRDAGHTADNQKANAEAYNALPACCQYKNSAHKH